MAVVGGTASVLGGGKFASGAMAGAFMQMFNAEARKWIKELSIKQAYQLEDKVRALVNMKDKAFIVALGLPKHLGHIEVWALKRDLLNNIKQPVLRTALEATAGNLIPQNNVVTAYQVFTTYVLPDTGIGIAFVPGTVEIRGIYEIQ